MWQTRIEYCVSYFFVTVINYHNKRKGRKGGREGGKEGRKGGFIGLMIPESESIVVEEVWQQAVRDVIFQRKSPW